jgi:ring-1,2-phenylacetyl-CoA epoxidase subunit PaaE
MSAASFYPLTVVAVRPETDEAVCVTLAPSADDRERFRFEPGQYLTLRAEIDGETLSRSYSICAGPDEGPLQIGIKRVPGGRFSNWANDHLQPGRVIESMPPQGHFTPRLDPGQAKSYMMIAAGSGITPILSIIKAVLATEASSRVTLIYGNRRSASVMFRDDLSFIKNRYLDRFQWINIMDEEDQGSDLLNGRIDNEKGAALHQAGLIDVVNTDEAFICGPEAMMSEVSRGFRASGLGEGQIHYELFSSSSEDAEAALKKARERQQAFGEEARSRVTVIADGRSLSFELAAVGENILDAGLHQGMELPHACKNGVCATCKARLVKGRVDMDLTHGLEPREIEQGYILTCQAHPISEEVVVDFDQR